MTIEVPRSLFSKLRKEYGERVRLVEPDDEESINIHESEWYKKVSAGHTPGRALRVYRENRGLSQTELAEKLGRSVRKQHVADMEAGRRGISKDTAKRLSRILKAPVERFL